MPDPNPAIKVHRVMSVGVGLIYIQQQYGIVSLGDSTGNFVVNAYPVSVHYGDVAIIFVTCCGMACCGIRRYQAKNIPKST